MWQYYDYFPSRADIELETARLISGWGLTANLLLRKLQAMDSRRARATRDLTRSMKAVRFAAVID
jgi:hypothetical protein